MVGRTAYGANEQKCERLIAYAVDDALRLAVISDFGVMKGTTKNIVSALSEEIRRRSSAGPGPFLVAIDGRSGVGKSTVAESLCHGLEAALVCGDDFYAGGTEVRREGPDELADDCIDRAQLARALQNLKSSQPAEYFAFDWQAFDGRRSDTPRIVRPRPLIVLEGVYSNHPDLRSLVDFSVLLVVSDAKRWQRLVKREGDIGDWERQWHTAEDWYFDNLARTETFDVVLKAD